MSSPVARPTRVAVIGAGPSGATTAGLLAKKGASVVLLDDGKRPALVVGESLVPLLTVVFQRLGIEDAVCALGVRKPGVTFSISEDTVFPLTFDAVRGVLPTYAYNVPRKEFDQLVLDTALKAGVRYISTVAKLVADRDLDTVQLAPETLELIPEWNGQQPDVVIDASGRRRLLARLLDIPASVGPRQDVAHFAHYENCPWPEPAGQVEIGRLEKGWSWQIPLPGRLSVGVVVNRDHAKKFGPTGEEQLEGLIENDRRLATATHGRRRVSPVATYANYQLISHRGSGRGWAMVGDAFGFVDPMLSPGLCMAMVSAEKLADTIPAEGGWKPALHEDLTTYWQWFRDQLAAWQNLVNYFYDGRIFAMHRTGTDFSKMLPAPVGNAIQRHIGKNFAGMASGALTSHPYSRGLLAFLGKYGIRGYEPADFAIQ